MIQFWDSGFWDVRGKSGSKNRDLNDVRGLCGNSKLSALSSLFK